MNKKVIRITTVPMSITTLLRAQLRFINQYYHVLAVSTGVDMQNDVAKDEDVKTNKALTMTRTIAPFKDLKSLYQLYKFFKKEKPFIVHTCI